MEQIYSRNAVYLLIHGQNLIEYDPEMFCTNSGRYVVATYLQLKVFHMRDKVRYCDNKKLCLVIIYLQFVRNHPCTDIADGSA